MIPLVLALLALLAQGPDRLPEARAIDSVNFSFTGGPFDPPGSLTITAAGNLSYRFSPLTFGGAKRIEATWEVPKAEVAKLFQNLVEHGLLDLPEHLPSGAHTFHVTSGRWSITGRANAVPERILADLLPYLAKAHPDKWKEKPCDKKPVATEVRYIFTEKLDGWQMSLTVARTGEVQYTRLDNSPNAEKPMPVNESWRLEQDDAEKLLDALITGGLLKIDTIRGGSFPAHYVQVSVGRWTTEFFQKDLPDAVMKHLRPLLEKADPTVWKK